MYQLPWHLLNLLVLFCKNRYSLTIVASFLFYFFSWYCYICKCILLYNIIDETVNTTQSIYEYIFVLPYGYYLFIFSLLDLARQAAHFFFVVITLRAYLATCIYIKKKKKVVVVLRVASSLRADSPAVPILLYFYISYSGTP